MAVKKKTATTKPAPVRSRKPVAKAVSAVEAAQVMEVNLAEVAPVPEAAPAAEVKAAVPKKAKTARYLLPGNMEIASLGPVHADLVAMDASNEGPFVLDGANLSVIDTAGLQLLISFVSSVKASGKKVSWDNYSIQAYQLANELGVVDQLGD